MKSSSVCLRLVVIALLFLSLLFPMLALGARIEVTVDEVHSMLQQNTSAEVSEFLFGGHGR
ncbi:MAG TPA: hypothetical protein ENN68_04900 [Methanomicrobia archaeon]|nr:hypothetical protein [Methanomicrobia archaeon]